MSYTRVSVPALNAASGITYQCRAVFMYVNKHVRTYIGSRR